MKNAFSILKYLSWLAKFGLLRLNDFIMRTWVHCGIFMGATLALLMFCLIPQLAVQTHLILFCFSFLVGSLLKLFLNGLKKSIKQNWFTKEVCFKIDPTNRISESTPFLVRKEVSRLISEVIEDEFLQLIQKESTIKSVVLLTTHDAIIKKLFKLIKKYNLSLTVTISGRVFLSYEDFQKAILTKQISHYKTSSNFIQLLPFLETECVMGLLADKYLTSKTQASEIDGLFEEKSFYKIKILPNKILN